jgi:hypothetical protein
MKVSFMKKRPLRFSLLRKAHERLRKRCLENETRAKLVKNTGSIILKAQGERLGLKL